jgi:hypothetical protein
MGKVIGTSPAFGAFSNLFGMAGPGTTSKNSVAGFYDPGISSIYVPSNEATNDIFGYYDPETEKRPKGAQPIAVQDYLDYYAPGTTIDDYNLLEGTTKKTQNLSALEGLTPGYTYAPEILGYEAFEDIQDYLQLGLSEGAEAAQGYLDQIPGLLDNLFQYGNEAMETGLATDFDAIEKGALDLFNNVAVPDMMEKYGGTRGAWEAPVSREAANLSAGLAELEAGLSEAAAGRQLQSIADFPILAQNAVGQYGQLSQYFQDEASQGKEYLDFFTQLLGLNDQLGTVYQPGDAGLSEGTQIGLSLTDSLLGFGGDLLGSGIFDDDGEG